ncbi:MAG: hypothetical protein JNM18_08170 [Planctomycetaceae bacterium]|nr:hypothetical protein [Planctomycetaceae bacterium]
MSKRKPRKPSKVTKRASKRLRDKRSQTEESLLKQQAFDEFKKLPIGRRAAIVAPLAWRELLNAGCIARRLNFELTSEVETTIHRAMRHAYGKTVKFTPERDIAYEAALHEYINVKQNRVRPILFHVVDDQFGPALTAVPTRAANVIFELIESTVSKRVEQDPNGKLPVVIGNAGGQTVATTIKVMRRECPQWADYNDEKISLMRDRLRFVSGNAAYHANRFEESANYLSVSLAESFGSKHYALQVKPDRDNQSTYQLLIQQTAIFICGVGSINGSSLTQFFADHGVEVPDNAVGDIAFNWLKAEGKPIEHEGAIKAYMHEVNPVMTADQLLITSGRARVVVVLDGDQPLEKIAISTAVLRGTYVTDVVVGTRLARELLLTLGWKESGGKLPEA